MKNKEERKSAKISVRVTEIEKEKITKYAEERNQTVSQVIYHLLKQII